MTALELFANKVAKAAAHHGGRIRLVPLAPAAAILTCTTAYGGTRSIVLFDIEPHACTSDTGSALGPNDVSDRLLLRHRFKRSERR